MNYKTKTSVEESVKQTAKFIKKRGVKEFNYDLPLEIQNAKTPKTWKNKII